VAVEDNNVPETIAHQPHGIYGFALGRNWPLEFLPIQIIHVSGQKVAARGR
jgi:hypothetical protein